MAGEYQTVYAGWERAPDAFWREAAGAIDWVKTGDQVFDPDAGVYGRWFPGWETNTCHNCIDRHVEAGHGDRTAIIYDSPLPAPSVRSAIEKHATRSRPWLPCCAGLVWRRGIASSSTCR